MTEGPLHRHGWRGLVVSLTGALAIELRHQVEAIAAASGLAVEVRKSPYPGQVIGPDRCRVTILASDRATGHGLGVDLAVLDEAGFGTGVKALICTRRCEVLSALATAGCSPSRSWVIRAASWPRSRRGRLILL